MALVKCPECGKEVSDRAKICPNCGYPLDEVHQPMIIIPDSPESAGKVQNASDNEPRNKKKISFNKHILIPIIICAIVAFGIVSFVVGHRSVTVNELKISSYKEHTDDTLYTFSLESDCKSPFIAIVDENIEDESVRALNLGYLHYVYMKDGKGSFVASPKEADLEDHDKNPFFVSGYLCGKQLSDNDIASVDTDAHDFDDYDTYTSCLADITVKMKSRKNNQGILFCRLYEKTDQNCAKNNIIAIVIEDGAGTITATFNEISYGSTASDLDVVLEPLLFCKSKKISKNDIEDSGKMTFDSEYLYSSSDLMFWFGKQEIYFSDIKNSLLIYSEELQSGGVDKNIGKTEYKIIRINGSKATIRTVDMADILEDGDDEPVFKIRPMEIVNYKTLSD